MAYTPKVWACGDTITANDLNHIEEGIAKSSGGGTSEPLMVNYTHTEDHMRYFDKTWQQVHDAYMNGQPVIFDANDDDGIVFEAVIGCGPTYEAPVETKSVNYLADSEDGYMHSEPII